MFVSICTPIRDAHESPSHIYGTAHGERCGQCGELIAIDYHAHDADHLRGGGFGVAECSCTTVELEYSTEYDGDGYCRVGADEDVLLERHQETALENAEQHLCGYSDECEGQRDGVWFEGQLLRFARSVPLVGCVEGPGIHEARTLVPGADVLGTEAA